MKPTLFLAVTLCASSLATRPARAQATSVPGSYFAYPLTPTPVFLPPIVQDVGREIGNKGSKTPPRGAGRTPKAGAVTTYRASRAVSQRVKTRLIAFVAKSNSPATVAQLKGELQGDVIGRWVKGMSSNGLRGGDVADAMAANWVQNWQFANDAARIPPTQVRGVRRQLAGMLASNAAFAKLSNAQRQEMAEGFIYSQTLQRSAYFAAVIDGDRAPEKRISDAAASGFKKSTGLDLRTVKLTDAGFAAKP